MQGDPIQPGVVKVNDGESLSAIAKKFGLSLDNLLKLNPQFNPAEAKAPVKNLAAEKAKARAGAGDRHPAVILKGELLRVAQPEDSFMVSAEGLKGSTSDPALARADNNRLLALRRLADRGNDKGGRPDGVVSDAEARAYMADAQGALDGEFKSGPERYLLDAFEQKDLIEKARKTIEDKPSSANAATKELYNKAAASFSVETNPKRSPEKLATAAIHEQFAEHVAPMMLTLTPNLVTDRLLAADGSGAASVKAFTPNANLVRGEKGAYAKKQVALKLHGWGAVRGEIAVSRVFVNADGSKSRTAAISAAAGVQGEFVGDVSGPRLDGRLFVTANKGWQVQYQITTTPERLEKILSGEIPLPNPYADKQARGAGGKTMQTGDTVTFTSGPIGSMEYEARVLGGKGQLRAGLDVKHDRMYFEGDTRLVVRKLKDDHFQVFQGHGMQGIDATGVGFIANPKIASNSGKLEYASQGSFFRLLPQYREVAVHNQFSFVEVNAGDLSPGGGRAVFERILETNSIPTAQSLQPIHGVVAHGTLDFKELARHVTLQTTLYNEPSHPIDVIKANRAEKARKTAEAQGLSPSAPAAPPPATLWEGSKWPTSWKNIFEKNNVQFSAQHSIDISSQIQTDRDIFIRHEYPDQIIRSATSGHDDAVNTEVKLGSGTAKHTRQFSALGDTRVTETVEINQGTAQRLEHPVLLVQNKGDKDSVTKAVEGMLRDEAAGKPPLFEDFVVRGKDATGKETDYRGKDALAYLRARKDTSNDYLWGLIEGRDTVTISISTRADGKRTDEVKLNEFVAQYRHDYAEFNKDRSTNFLTRAMRAHGNAKIAESQAHAAMLGSEYLMLQDGGLSAAQMQRAKSRTEALNILAGFDLGEMIQNMQRYRETYGSHLKPQAAASYYPVRVTIQVGY